MENNDQGGIKRSNEKPLRIKKLISVEDGSAICEKKWKQTAICDPDNTKQTSNGSPSRRIKDAICLTDPEQRKGEKKNVGERVSYEQNKENQSRKQYSLRSKAKTQKEESDIRSSAISRMSSRNSASTMETNGISMCAKPVSPDMKAPTGQAGNHHGDQAVNNYMDSISDQSVNKYMDSIGDQAVNNYISSVVDQSVNDYKGSIHNQVRDGSSFMVSCRDQADNQYRNISNNTDIRSYKRHNSGYMDNLVKNSYYRQHQQYGQEATNILDFQHTAAVPQIIHASNIFSFSGYQCATMIPLLYPPNSLCFSGLYLMIPLFR